MPKSKLQTEYDRLTSRKKELEKELNLLPKGSIRMKMINGHEYPYLQYRDGNHIRSEYIKKDDLEDVSEKVKKRGELQKQVRAIARRQKQFEQLLGICSDYIPARNVDYEEYVLFMSAVAHDYKRLTWDAFLEKYDTTKYRGTNKRYLKGFFDYILGIRHSNTRKSRELVLDPYTQILYSQYGRKDVLTEELKKAIPAFLNYGLLITSVQEAVRGA